MNIRIIASDGLQQAAPTYVGDIPAGGSATADVAAVFTKIGAYMGTLVVQYEDANGQLYTATAQVQLNLEDPENSNNNAVDPNQGGNGSGNGGDNGSGGGFFGTVWPWIILAVIVIAAAAAVIIAVSKKKKSPVDPT